MNKKNKTSLCSPWWIWSYMPLTFDLVLRNNKIKQQKVQGGVTKITQTIQLFCIRIVEDFSAFKEQWKTFIEMLKKNTYKEQLGK